MRNEYMMIELEERYRRLVHKLEQENNRSYRVSNIKDHYYISIDDLLDALDDTQDSREYAEEKISELNREISDRPIECNSLQIHTLEELNRLKEENIELQTKIEMIQSTLDEDDYDRLAGEGIEF